MKMSYPIRQDFLSGLPKSGYRNGVGKWEGVCMHDTATMNDSDENQTKYFKANWKTRQAFVHGFCDHDSITQHSDWNYKSWGCGNGNSRFINIELCNTKDPAKFEAGFDRWCWLAALKLFERKLGVIDGKTLVSHQWVSHNLGGTNHSDPIGYLRSHNRTWQDVVNRVKYHYDLMANPKPTPAPTPKPTTPKPMADTYVIEKGDTLWGISHEFGITVEKLKELNPELKEKALQIGDTIKLRATSTVQTYTIQAGDTYYGLAKKLKFDVNETIAMNPDYPPAKLKVGAKIKYKVVDRIVATPKPPVPKPIGVATVTASMLNVRAGAGTGYKIVKTVKKGSGWQVWSEKDGWYNIGGDQWISKKYTTFRK
jgi:LysM repeat protein